MNFLYYKNFGDDKPSSTAITFKKKKDHRKSKTLNYGHHADCTCEVCSTDYPLRTHLLLDMSFSRADGSDANKGRKATKVSSVFRFFGLRKKSSQMIAERRPPCSRFCEANERDRAAAAMSSVPNGPLEPVTLATLKQDCFLIPVARINNFFPAGHAVPSGDSVRLRMLETTEPDVRVLFHLIGAAVPFIPSLPSPTVDIHDFQRDWVVKAFKSAVAGVNIGSALQGMVLLNLEKGGELGQVDFPFMIVWAIDCKLCDFKSTAAKVREISLEALDPVQTGFTLAQFFDTFDEVATLARPPIEKVSRRASTPGTGYIISVFKVFEGDDGQKFERNWLYWTGARALYCNMTNDVGLRRLTLHKSPAQRGSLYYLLLCECANFLSQLCTAVRIVPRLRMRLCGDTGLYRPICSV